MDRTAAPHPVVLVVMGVSGCGKSTVAAVLSRHLGWVFAEGDNLHPPTNVNKMAAGHPLTDQDRWPWLERVAEWVEARLDAGQNGIITCSALKRSYRDTINRRHRGVVLVYLAGSRDMIAARLPGRHGHFMPATLLDSQFATLQEPTADEPVLRVDAGPPAELVARHLVDQLGLHPSTRTGPTAMTMPHPGAAASRHGR